MTRKYLLALFTTLALVLLLAWSAQAAAVGKFTVVQGQVDVLKQGKLPAIPAKVQDGVEPGDVIRTKSKSKAQVQFVDDTTLTLAPETRVAIADYLYDPARSERRAVLRVFRGLAHTVVTRILQIQEPDFIMQTMTAGIGVRGSRWYTLLKPNSAVVYLIKGLLGVSSSNLSIPGVLLLKDRQYTEVFRDRAPGPIKDVTPADEEMLQRWMDTGVPDTVLLEAPPEVPALRLPKSPEDALQPSINPMLQPGTQPPRDKIIRGPSGDRTTR